MKPYHDPAEQIETEDKEIQDIIPPKEPYKGPITRSRIKTLGQNDSLALRKDEIEWQTKNLDATSYIKISLADEQVLQFAAEDNAKVLWDKIKATFIGRDEDRKIDAGNEHKNIVMKNGETVGDYFARVRGISTKCHSLGLEV
ncbi:retrovirus-related Pol polyprotein from transposon TNT 1-94 [Trichonephila clavipes]|nr:retrovirus-related Pol polyprotein from transposon TNT 1-94 [Trichonephila clavipes]